MNKLMIRQYSVDLKGHSHSEYHQILMPLFGHIQLFIDEKCITAHYGDAVFIQKGVFHQFQASQKFSFLVMNTVENIVSFDDIHFSLNQNILSYLTFINKQLPVTNNLQIEAGMYNLLKQLIVNLPKQNKFDIRIKKAIHIMKDNIADEHSINILSEIACLSPSRFKVLFKQHMNCTPFEYLTKIRMEKAVGLIRYTDIPITIVAEQCGYKSASSFTKRFTQHHHITPLQFRKNANH